MYGTRLRAGDFKMRWLRESLNDQNITLSLSICTVVSVRIHGKIARIDFSKI